MMVLEDDPPAGVPEWIVTYGDMMSLLLTFFIMLVSMSEMKDEGKNRAALDSMRETFAPENGDSGIPGRSMATNSDLNFQKSKGETHEDNGLERANQKSTGPGGAERPVAPINHGEEVTMGGTVTFEQFSTELDQETRAQLDRIVDAVARKPQRIIIRGHSFAEPLRQKPQFRDQHDLSFARARTVANYLIERQIRPDRILVSAAGDSEARVLTRSIEERRLNRRVDVFTIGSYVASPGAAR